MSRGKPFRPLVASSFAFAVLSAFSGCSSGGSGSANSIGTAVQDLTADPEGETTVITFTTTGGLSLATAADFEANGSQTALTASVAGNVVTVTWDERVSPNHQVRAFGLGGVSSAYHAVTTSDASAPTFTVGAATQNPNLGGDTITLTFAGPHVVETEAEDPARWTLRTDGQTLDLTGTTFDFDTGTQTLDVTLGVNANLHATFTLAATNLHSVAETALSPTPVNGNATGDTTAPTLVSANQNLTEDEYGRVVDFTFSEAMDPVFSIALSHFAALPDVATTVEQPSEDVLRVTFNNPMVPGYDTVTLQSLVDLHGNAFPDTVQAIAQPSPVVNSFSGNVSAVTVANAGSDFVQATTSQAFDPDSALDPTLWSLIVDGNPIDLTLQTFSYDLISKTLTIELVQDLLNGDSFTLQGVGVLDVDGDTFSLSQTQAVGGETTAPNVASAQQNRSLDSSGMTIDVQMSEDVDAVTSQTLMNWTASGGQNVLTATLMPGLDLVRLEFDATLVPGDATLTAQNVRDLAGNPMAVQAGISLTSTDTTPPTPTGWSLNVREGANNDVVEVLFDDDMVPSDVTDVARWSLESPIGTTHPTAGATVEYESTVRRARLKLENGVNLRRDDDYKVVLTGVRDLGGNAFGATPMTGLVLSESTLPYVHTIWRPTASPDQVEVRFSEPCDLLEDLYDAGTNPAGTRYVLRTSGGILLGYATSATSLDDGLGVEVSFGIVLDPADTVDVLGAIDLTGNPLFPAMNFPTVDEDPAEPGFALGLSTLTAVTGEQNDVLTVQFDRPVSPWTVADHIHYTVTGPTPVEKRSLDVVFDGIDTVTLPLLGNANDYDLLTGSPYDLQMDGIRTAQGVPMSLPTTEFGILVVGDATAPSVQVGKVRIDPSQANTLLVEFREAMASPSATNVANYLYDGVHVPVAAVMINPRVVRLTFAVAPQVGFNLGFDADDLAGNPSGAAVRAVSAADATGPLVVGVAGVIRPGFGGDEVHVTYDEPVKGTTALNPANYSVQTGGSPRSLAGAAFSYSSVANVVRIRLAGGQELLTGQSVGVGIAGIQDLSGNAMSAGLQVGGSTTGDSTAPSFVNAFVNRRIDLNGSVVDVLFDEDIDSAFVNNPLNWTVTGGPSVVGVAMRERNHARLTLSAALPAAGTVQMTGAPDLAGNVAATIQIDPAD